MKPWLTVGEGAEHAGVSRDTIYTACERKELRHARISGRRSIRLKPEWIDAWLERHVLEAEDRCTVGCTAVSVKVQSEATS
jgi:excisionase family DNA binding protein